ncbi:hypothetical protein NMG60_11020290 [Bertholletia excelsa]
MHAIRGGWVGRPFVLAKRNDCGGRRSRIRRSKEERKEMVESFINKYQKSNNGNFPSLNLTHKEVGGSFYTVREIVREVIQENRVLGPAKLTAEEQSLEKLLEPYPSLQSSSTELTTDLSPPNEINLVSHTVSSHHDKGSEQLVFDSHAQYAESRNESFDEGEMINGPTKAVQKDEHYDKSITDVTHAVENVIAEAIPLVSNSFTTKGLDEKSSASSELTRIFVPKEIEKLETEAGSESMVDSMNSRERFSVLGNEEADASQAGELSQGGPGLTDEKQVNNPEAALMENAKDCTTKESSISDSNQVTHSEVEDVTPIEIKTIDALDGVQEKNLESISPSCSYELSISENTVASENNPRMQVRGSSFRGSNPTLDAKNLESLENLSANSSRPAPNPLLDFLKALIVALWKLLSK